MDPRRQTGGRELNKISTPAFIPDVPPALNEPWFTFYTLLMLALHHQFRLEP